MSDGKLLIINQRDEVLILTTGEYKEATTYSVANKIV